MFPSLDADAAVSVDRWAVRLDEPAHRTVAEASDSDADDLPFLPFLLDIPTDEFHPRLSRFGEAA